MVWYDLSHAKLFTNPHVPGQTIEASLEGQKLVLSTSHSGLFDPCSVIIGGLW